MGDDGTVSDGNWQAQVKVSERLMELYAVGAGLALAIGVERMVRQAGDGATELRWSGTPLFLALLVTLIPFYHGALRHLQQRWIDQHDGMTRLSLMVDFTMLFAGVSVMFAMAYLVTQPLQFATALIVLLAVDCLWALSFHFLLYRILSADQGLGEWARGILKDGWLFVWRRRRDESFEELNWLWLNVAAILVGTPLLVVARAVGVEPGWPFALGLLAFALVRTLVDYRTNSEFYFPGLKSFSEERQERRRSLP